jgi:predicted P-loop ATPase
VVRDRKPYGHRDIIKPAISNFLGTINSDGSGFLIDRTGNRRFLVCQVEKIDWGYSDTVSVDQLWAQAVKLYTSRSAWFLTGNDMDARDARNEDFLIDDPIESFLGALFEFTGDASHFVTLTDVCDLLADRVKGIGQRSQAMTASRVFQEWGAKKRRITSQGGQRVITYFGVRVL